MASVTLTSNWDLRSFRTGLTEMKTEGARFRDSFKKSIEGGGGLFGSIDKGLGTLASGRFAVPIAAIGAALTVAKVATEAMSKQWENIANATERAAANAEAIQATRDAVQSAAKSGDALTAAQEIALKGKQSAAASAAADAAAMADPSTFAGARKMANELNGGGNSLSGFITFMRISAGRMGVPFFGGDYEAANKLFNDRQQRAQDTRNEAETARQLKPFVDFANQTTQRSAQAGQIAAEDRLNVAQGRTTAYEAAANQLLLANAQFQSTKALFGENDPRTIQAKTAALSAFTAYDTEITQARRFRNDPTIAADSMARLGGGGGVNVFGDGRGELLFEQKRLNQSTQQLIGVMRELNVTLSRRSSNDIR
jgi:hypothetical protein